MSSKQYHVPTMPDDEAQEGFHGLIAKLRAMTGVQGVTVDRTSKHVTVHLNEDDESLPHVDQAIWEFGQLPGFTGQA